MKNRKERLEEFLTSGTSALQEAFPRGDVSIPLPANPLKVKEAPSGSSIIQTNLPKTPMQKPSTNQKD